MAGLKRQLGLLDATMINVGTIIASAIFIVPSTIALQLHATLPAILVWVVGGVVSMLGALSLAELGAALPETGGGFVYLARAYGPIWGFLYGWANGAVINPASIAAIAVGFAGYLTVFVPLSPAGIKAVAIGAILLLTVLNSLGVRAGARTQNVLTLLKIGILVALIVVGFGLAGGSPANFRPLWPAQSVSGLIGPFGVAMVAALGAYDGWVEATYGAGGGRDPGRILPRFLTPVPSLAVQALISCLLTLSGTYDQLFTYVIFTEFLFYALICGAVIRLRVVEPELPRPYRTWGYPVTPVVFIAFAAWLVRNTVLERPRDALVGTAILLLGLPVYWIWRRRED